MPGSGPLRTAGVPGTKRWCNAGEPQASTTKAGGRGPPAPSTGSQRQEAQGGDVLALGRVVKPRSLQVFRSLNPWGNRGAAPPQQSTESLPLLSSCLEGYIPTEWDEAPSGTSFKGNAPFFSPQPCDLAKHRQLCSSHGDDSSTATPSSQCPCRGSGSQLQRVRVLRLPAGRPASLPDITSSGRLAGSVPAGRLPKGLCMKGPRGRHVHRPPCGQPGCEAAAALRQPYLYTEQHFAVSLLRCCSARGH